MDNDPMFNAAGTYLNALNSRRNGTYSDDDVDMQRNISPNDPRADAISINSCTSNSTNNFSDEHINNQQLVIYNLKESEYNESSRESADICTVQLILLAIDAWKAANDIKKVTRIGQYGLQGNPRPIHICFFAEESHRIVLQNAQKLQNTSEWKNLSIEIFCPLERNRKPSPSVHQAQPVDVEKEALQQQVEMMRKQMENMMKEKQQQQLPQQHHFPPQQHHEISHTSPLISQRQHDYSQQFQRYSSNNSLYQPVPVNPVQNMDSSMNYGSQTMLHLRDPGLYRSVSQMETQQNNYSNIPHSQTLPRMGVSSRISYQIPTPELNPFQQRTSPNGSFVNFQQGNQAQIPMQNYAPYSSNMQPDMMSMMQTLFEQFKANTATMPSSQAQPQESETSSESEEECEDEEEPEQPTYTNELFNAQWETSSGPKKTLNILVLGETGVGKSTWINGIANYMSFNTLEEALAAPQPICLIASKFSFYQSNEDKIEVKLEPSHGEKDANEAFSDQGQSSTQDPKTYQFETAKYIVNIIDTPGIGDTRGPDQDKENTRKILNAIAQYKDLHAICFLFHANVARMTLSFRYCIGELLLQLHKDAVDNIIFFFTNARGTFYKPGDTMGPLSEFLSQLKEKRGLRIPLSNDKICCTDNEAFRLVCAHYCGAIFTDDVFQNFAGSWRQSAAETHRFIEFAARQRPHSVADTVSINKARTIILHLAKPLADVNELIETNIKIFDDRKKDLQNTSNNLNDLKKKLKISQVGIKIIPLSYPKTVCAAQECIETQRLPNTEQYQTIYKQICHDHCYLTGVDAERVPEPNLMNCAAMSGNICQECGCPWSTHMHIRFDQIKDSKEVEDENTKDLIKMNVDASLVKQKMIDDTQATVDELKAEQQKIIQISLRFGSFLQANAILPYNDAFEKYVEQTISEEEKCTEVGGDRSKLDNLKKLLAEYRQEKTLLSEAAKNPTANGNNIITPNEIENMKTELFGLNHTGKTLEDLFKATEDGIANHNSHITVKYTPARRPSQPPQFGKYKNQPKKKSGHSSWKKQNPTKKEKSKKTLSMHF
uniref:G domain-containing protein n=1 Tax=Panagrolaimus sp. PS1159 TaxID=55785 RepID=A0AC35GTP7_9BILA